jgi:hypothetical protein
MNFQRQLRSALLGARRNRRSLAMSSFSGPAFHHNQARLIPGAAVARMIPIISSG